MSQTTILSATDHYTLCLGVLQITTIDNYETVTTPIKLKQSQTLYPQKQLRALYCSVAYISVQATENKEIKLFKTYIGYTKTWLSYTVITCFRLMLRTDTSSSQSLT